MHCVQSMRILLLFMCDHVGGCMETLPIKVKCIYLPLDSLSVMCVTLLTRLQASPAFFTLHLYEDSKAYMLEACMHL